MPVCGDDKARGHVVAEKGDGGLILADYACGKLMRCGKGASIHDVGIAPWPGLADANIDAMKFPNKELLPAPYFHVVFTLPGLIADIAYQNKAVIYDLLFRAAADTMLTIAADPKHLGASIGITAVLHTWGSAMTHHPHLHMIVPGGGLSLDGKKWLVCRPGFFLPVGVYVALILKGARPADRAPRRLLRRRSCHRLGGQRHFARPTATARLRCGGRRCEQSRKGRIANKRAAYTRHAHSLKPTIA